MNVLKSISALLLALTGTQVASETRSLNLTTGDWPPYIFQWEGTIHPERPGSSVEIVTRIMGEIGYDLSFTALPFLRQISETEKGAYDAMVGLYAQEAPHLVFPREPIGISRNCFFTTTDSEWSWAGLESLAGRSFAIVDGYNYGEVDSYIPDHRDQFIAITGHELGLMERLTALVDSGRVDAFIQDHYVALHFFEKDGLRDRFKSVGCMQEIPIVMGFSPENPKTATRVEEFDRIFAELRASGEIARILKKYGVEDWK